MKRRATFANQKRSYVLDRDEVTDHRTGVKQSAKRTLNGDLRAFLIASMQRIVRTPSSNSLPACDESTPAD